MDKQTLRQQMRTMREGMRHADVQRASHAVCDTLLQMSVIEKAQCVMAYSAFRNEIDLSTLLSSLTEQHKRVFLPHVTGDGEMIAAECLADSKLKRSDLGILEPEIEEESISLPMDVIIVPGVAFDTSMYRIGFGGGYYDRFLSGSGAVKIGVCYDEQIVDTLAHELHDIPMDMIVTDKRILERNA